MAEHPRIEVDPNVMVGKPVIRGTRITVELIVRRFADGYTLADILDDYPHLTAEDVYAACREPRFASPLGAPRSVA
jgi:uncharacterized protein (DUF433 family)